MIISAAPFEFADGACLVSFTNKDVIDNNRKRGLAVWSPRLLDLERAGYIEIVERPEQADELEANDFEPAPAVSVTPKARPGRKQKAAQ